MHFLSLTFNFCIAYLYVTLVFARGLSLYVTLAFARGLSYNARFRLRAARAYGARHLSYNARFRSRAARAYGACGLSLYVTLAFARVLLAPTALAVFPFM